MKRKGEKRYFCDWFENKKNAHRLFVIVTLISFSVSDLLVLIPSFEGTVISKLTSFVLGGLLFMVGFALIIGSLLMISANDRLMYHSDRLETKLDFYLEHKRDFYLEHWMYFNFNQQ